MLTIWDTLSVLGGWATKVHVQAVVLAFIVAALSFLARRWLTSGWRSTLWLIVFARLVIPDVPASSMSLFNVFGVAGRSELTSPPAGEFVAQAARTESHAAVNVAGGNDAEHPVSAPASAARHDSPGLLAGATVLNIAVLVWIAGAVLFALRLCWQTWSLRRRLSRLPEIEQCQLVVLAERCAAEARLGRTPRLLAAPDRTGPAVFGWARPVLLLPRENVEQMDRADLRLVLLHEMRHVRSGDCVISWILAVLVAIHWFNPLLWWAKRRWQAERELACDAWVLRHVGPRERHRYGATLLKIVETAGRPGLLIQSVGMAAFPTLIERRIRAMKTATHRTWLQAACGPLALILLVATGLTDRASQGENEPVSSRAEQTSKQATAGQTEQPGKADAPATKETEKKQTAAPRIVIAQHVILWDQKIVTWEEVVAGLREIRADGPFRATFYTTNGVHQTEQGWQFWHDRIMDIYREMFEPVGVTFASVSPRGSRRLDTIRTADDLIPSPARARRGRVLTADGAPVAGAQVIVLPMTDVLGVALSGHSLRDSFDEQWVPTDEQGRFTVYPDEDEYFLAVLHATGFVMQAQPAATDENIRLRITPWAIVSFTTTGGVADQSASITIQPDGTDSEAPEFRVYSIDALGKPVDVPVPPGRVTVSRSLKMEQGSSISLPVESFALSPGEKRTLALEEPSDEDRQRAFDLRGRF